MLNLILLLALTLIPAAVTASPAGGVPPAAGGAAEPVPAMHLLGPAVETTVIGAGPHDRAASVRPQQRPPARAQPAAPRPPG